jgi:hypothetical protein
MTNPVLKIIPEQRPFTYFHTHVVSPEILEAAIAAHKSLELDISITPKGKIYVGHPLSFYDFWDKPRPNNVPLDAALARAKETGLFLVFDAKDALVLPRIQQAILDHGIDRCLLHAFVEELVFKPFASKIVEEPHWGREQLPLEKVLAVKRATGVQVALACRGLTNELWTSQDQTAIIKKILDVAVGNVDVVIFNFPKDEVAPTSLYTALLEHGIVPHISMSRVPRDKRPTAYLGTTDDLADATVVM